MWELGKRYFKRQLVVIILRRRLTLRLSEVATPHLSVVMIYRH